MNTRQGCSLSSLLFALVIEPLSNMIRGERSVRGFQYGTHTEKSNFCTVYANDIPTFFGSFSELRMNWSKSALMPLHEDLKMGENGSTCIRVWGNFSVLRNEDF